MSARGPKKAKPRNLADAARAAVWATEAYSSTAKLVALSLIDNGGWATGSGWSSQATTAKRCRITDRSVRNALKEIEDSADGPLIFARESRLGRTDVYTYTLRAPWNVVPDTPERDSDLPGSTFQTPRNYVPTINVGVTESDNPRTNVVERENESGSLGDRPLASPNKLIVGPIPVSDWKPSPIHASTAHKHGLDIHEHTEKFRDWHIKEETPDQTHAVWCRKFGGWLKRNYEAVEQRVKTPEQLAKLAKEAEAADLADWRAGRGKYAD